MTLFERNGRQVVLTPAGEILLPYAEKILADVTEARVRMEEAHGGTVGIVRIGVIPPSAAHFLPTVFKEWAASLPAFKSASELAAALQKSIARGSAGGGTFS